MDVKEIIRKKNRLDEDILALVNRFEEETSMVVTDIDIFVLARTLSGEVINVIETKVDLVRN